MAHTQSDSAAACPPNTNGHHELTAEARCRLLLEVSQSVRGTLDLRETLDRLMDGLQSLLPYDAGGIFILHHEMSPPRVGPLGDQIAGVSWRGFTPRSPLTDPMLNEGKGIVGHVIHTGEAVCAPDVRVDSRYIKGRDSTRSEVAVPILLDGRTIGALNLESDRITAFDRHDVEILCFFAEATAIAVEKAMLHERLVENGHFERQLRTAREIQERLLPVTSPIVPGHELAGVCMPSAQVGGDYFDYVPLSGGRLGIVVADVSGHDIPAALIMSAFRALVRTNLRAGCDLDEIALRLNEELPDSTARSAFVTAVLAVLDPNTGAVRYVNCGHPPPLLDRAAGPPAWLDRGGPLLGLLDEGRFEIGEVQLDRGEQILFFTDGVIEASNPTGVDFGIDRLAERVSIHRARSPRKLVEHIVLDARRFAGVNGFEDDVTAVLLRAS